MVVPINQLRGADATIRFSDGDREVVLNVSRKRSGLVALTCSCVPDSEWCRHQIDLLTGTMKPQGDLACDIEDIYFGTRLAERAEDVLAAMEHFDREFRAPLDKPAATVDALDDFAVSAAVLADAASDWRLALERYLAELRRGSRD